MVVQRFGSMFGFHTISPSLIVMMFHFLRTVFAQWAGPMSRGALLEPTLEPTTHGEIGLDSAEDVHSANPQCDDINDWELVESDSVSDLFSDSDSDIQLDEDIETERPVVPLHVGTRSEPAKPIAKAPQGPFVCCTVVPSQAGFRGQLATSNTFCSFARSFC